MYDLIYAQRIHLVWSVLDFFQNKTLIPKCSRKFRRSQYSLSDMANALSAVRNNQMKKYEASKHFGVPLSTLLDKLSGRTPEFTNYGRIGTSVQTVLSDYSKTRRPKRRYTREAMLAALEAVRTGKMSRKEASIHYDVPYTTMLDKLCGRQQK